MRQSRRLLNLALLSAVAVLLASCSGLERRSSPSTTTTPSGGASRPAPTPTYESDNGEVADSSPTVRPPLKPKKVGVVIGPGGAKALAATGVLKELQRARIPVQEVIGLEWGALVGGLFAQRGQAHEMEWKLYKLEKQTLPEPGFFSSRVQPLEMKALRGYLKDSFSQMDIQRAQIAFSCPSQSLEAPDWRWAESGEMSREVENCMGFPPLFEVQRERMAGAFAAIDAVERLRKKGAEVVIFVNVLNPGSLASPRQLPDSVASAILWQEVRRNVKRASRFVDEWIEVDTSRIGLNEFARRKELFATGEKAGQLAAKHLIDKYGF